jgi:cytochrome oxidase Cu insertion factor (SCO1/SenC/PrrC family)
MRYTMNRHSFPALMCGFLLFVCSAMQPGCRSSQDTGKEQSDPQESVSEGGVGVTAPAADQVPQAASGSRILGNVPDFSLVDQTGATFTNADLGGRVWIANFIFTRCTGTCPTQTANMVQLQEELLADFATKGVRLVSFSVEPDHDSPEVLTDYATEHKADSRTWKFLTGQREAIWTLSKEGFRLPVADNPSEEGMPILHDAKIVLVDRLGRIRGYFDGMSSDGTTKLKKAIRFVLPEIEPPEYAPDLYADTDEVVTHIAHPPQLTDTDWLRSRQQAQLATTDQFDVFHDYGFTDAVNESGITFIPQIVDEQRWRTQVNHYDHAYGVSIADVDGDGRQDIYFLNQAGSNQLWRNMGGGKFEDMTDKAGVGVADRISVAGAFADTDNDGDADLFVTTVRGGNILFINDGSGVFSDVTGEAGLEYSGHSSTPLFFDYNRDGLIDLFVTNVGKYTTEEFAPVRMDRANSLREGEFKYYVGTSDAFGGHLKENHGEASLLYRNEGDNRFVEVSQEVGLVDESWSGDACPLDANDDGWPDLYVLNMQGHDQYYENEGGERFVRKSRELFPRTSWGAMGIKVFDFNNDGRLDIYISDMHSDMSVDDMEVDEEKLKSDMQWPESFLVSGGNSIYGNSLFQREEDGTYREVSDAVGAENYWPWGLSVGDLNADGFEDVFLASSMCFPFRYGVNSVLLNNRGQRFLDSEFILGVEPRRDGKLVKPWFELDADGEDKLHPMCRDRTGKVMVWSALGSRSSVIFDLDDDGDLDIVTNDFNSRPMVLISNLSERVADLWYLKIKLIGSQSNRDGLGAIVTVFAGDEAYVKVYDGKSGYLSQSLYPLYFGLGAAAEVERVDVLWPSGQEQSVPGPIEANTLVEIREES